MDPDLIFVIGLVLVAFSIPSMLSAYSEGRAPRVSSMVIVLAGVMIVYAYNTKPGGYDFATIPDTFMGVVARYIN
ncbi:hypothetical protein [Algirhabdus cladophorae]|uniref:hypothetical protein n=1 Tax=Algirhabdus cladophorae TaxID=3377108 RepID=UPI003B846531